jgi:hypothetical protein
MCFLQDDIVKFVSEPALPPRLVEIPDEGKGKAQERREVGVVWTSLGPLPRWVPGPTTRWAPGTTRLALHGT